jgi:hypothetical protein
MVIGTWLVVYSEFWNQTGGLETGWCLSFSLPGTSEKQVKMMLAQKQLYKHIHTHIQKPVTTTTTTTKPLKKIYWERH